MEATQEHIDLMSQCFCVPITIILNFSLFQYLLTVYFARRRDTHVRVLFLAAFLSFATIIPFAYPDEDLVRNLNDISEVCTVLTFTQQIAMLSREINKKMKLPVIARLGRVAELLVLLGLVALVANVVHIVAPGAEDIKTVEIIDMIVEYMTLIFIVSFRFYFLATVRGWKTVWEKQKFELVYYVLFLTHAVPFHVASDLTGLNLHHIQGLWMRVSMALCLSSTIRAKIATLFSDKSKATSMGGRTGTSIAPGAGGMDMSEGEDNGKENGPASTALKKWSSSWRNAIRPAVGVSPVKGPGENVVKAMRDSKGSQRGVGQNESRSTKVTAFSTSTSSLKKTEH